MKPAACSCRVSTSLMLDRRSDSSTSRFSSPGMAKMHSTPSCSSAATSRSEPFGITCVLPDYHPGEYALHRTTLSKAAFAAGAETGNHAAGIPIKENEIGLQPSLQKLVAFIE